MSSRPKYRIYIDEVGNPDLESAINPNHRFLSLTGVIISLQHVTDVLHPQMEELKNKYFGSHPDSPVILHRKEIVNARYPFHALKEIPIKEQFDAELLDLLRLWEYTVISVVIDKLEHKNQYQVWRYDPYHYCMAILLERFVFFLQQNREKGDAMAESRGGKEDLRLKNSYKKLFNDGTDYVTPESFKNNLTSCELKVKPKSSNISGLQLADLLAHPSRREILLREKKIQDNREDIFANRVVTVLQSKYYQKDGKIHGKKLLP